MKIFISLLFLSVVTASSYAQQGDVKVVSAAVEQLRKAMIDPDKGTLEALVSDSLSYGHSSGRIEVKKEFIDNLISGKSDFVSIDLTEQSISINGDVAIVRHTLSASTNDSGKPGTTKLKVLLIWHKEKKHWKLLARQAVKFI
jgi:ketosteroid isomerase-like protein